MERGFIHSYVKNKKGFYRTEFSDEYAWVEHFLTTGDYKKRYNSPCFSILWVYEGHATNYDRCHAELVIDK